MKRAVQEARELKKELVLLRQEKEELRAAAQKIPPTVSGGKEPIRHGSKERYAEKQGSNKAADLKLKQLVQTLTAQNKELTSSMSELQQQVAALESQNSTSIENSMAALALKDREIEGLVDELKKTKHASDEIKRKCHKIVKEKKEEAQRALQENEQLACCVKTLQTQLAALPQLKKQLERAKEKRVDVAEVWQKKLEQRDQAFLREEEASKQKLDASAAQITELMKDKLELQARLDELEVKLGTIDSNHASELSRASQRVCDLETAMNQLKEALATQEAAAQEAKRAEVVARETQEQETRLRQLAEDAADAVEIRAEKAERDLVKAQKQLERLEEALKARGVTLDYLLKQQIPVSIAGRTPSSDRDNNKTKIGSTSKKADSTGISGSTRAKAMVKSRFPTEDAKATSRTRLRRNTNNQEE
ncbi:unnamed protein product [Phytophthora fragariaefolia]|uniref:Unnamed protein product n=1 Tax=Phytophthora fragariaefolia TaxID=1490495 RepID=A0A9W7CS94_9STRA|nr:unnamed protein product [Phytophthora fragariaefolia]